MALIIGDDNLEAAALYIRSLHLEWAGNENEDGDIQREIWAVWALLDAMGIAENLQAIIANE